MGIADRIYELVKGLLDPEASRILRLVEVSEGKTCQLLPRSGGSSLPCSATIAGATMV